MDDKARERLKAAIAKSGKRSKDISLKLGFAPTYVSRIATGNIDEPSPSRLQQICDEIGTELSFILTGRTAEPNREEFLRDLSNASDDVISDVAAYVRTHGLLKR